MPVAAPLIMAGATVGSSLLASHAAGKSAQPTAAEQSALTAQTGAANQLTAQSKQLSQVGMPALRQSTSYFSKLAGGDKGAMQSSLAPEIGNINKTYGTTQQTISRFLRGPSRDFQLGEAERERAGAVSGLYGPARANANSMLANIAQGTNSAAAGEAGTAGSLFGANASQGAANRFGGAQLQEQAGADFGNLAFNLFKNFTGTKKAA